LLLQEIAREIQRQCVVSCNTDHILTVNEIQKLCFTNATIHRLPEEKTTTSRNSRLSNMGEKECRVDPAVGQEAGSAQLPSSGQGKDECEGNCAGKEKITQDIVHGHPQLASSGVNLAMYVSCCLQLWQCIS